MHFTESVRRHIMERWESHRCWIGQNLDMAGVGIMFFLRCCSARKMYAAHLGEALWVCRQGPVAAESAGVLSDAEGKLIILGDLLSTEVKKKMCSAALIYHMTRFQGSAPLNLDFCSVLASQSTPPIRSQKEFLLGEIYTVSPSPPSSVKIEKIRRREVYEIK